MLQYDNIVRFVKCKAEDNVMRRSRRGGSFFISLLFNMLINLEGSVPALILLALHFLIDISIGWFFLALSLWILYLVLWMLFVGWASSAASTPDKPRENKNPYSAKDPYKDRK